MKAPLFIRVLAGIFLGVSSGWAAAPDEVNYQGKLANAAGNPIDTPQDIRFRICDSLAGACSAMGTNMFHDQTFNGVPVTNGVFSVVLTGIAATAFQGGTTRYLLVSVGGTDLSPRQKLVAAPYALAVAADSVGNVEIGNNQIDADKLNGGAFQNEEYSFPNFLGIGIADPAYRLDVGGDINLTGQLRVNGNPAVFSNWTNVGPGGANVARNSFVGVNTAANPAFALDVNGDINIAAGSTLRIDGTAAVFSKWSDANSPAGALIRANPVAVGGLPVGNNVNYQLHVVDSDNANTIGITQGANTGELKVSYQSAGPSGFYAVYAP